MSGKATPSITWELLIRYLLIIKSMESPRGQSPSQSRIANNQSLSEGLQ
jgi:hypothetical protein